MRCEYCDSVIKTVPDNGICPNCGGVLPNNTDHFNKGILFPEPPVGMYRVGDDYMQLGEQGFRILKKRLDNESTDFSIAYSEIAAVKFVAGETLNPGFLCIRSKEEKHVPFPVTFFEKMYDKGTMFVHKRNNELFHKLYLFFEKCMDIVNTTEE